MELVGAAPWRTTCLIMGRLAIRSELIMLPGYGFRSWSPWPVRLKALWPPCTSAGPLAEPFPLWIIRSIWRYCTEANLCLSLCWSLMNESWAGPKINFFRHIFWWVMRENVKWSVKYSTDPLSIKLLYLQANLGGGAEGVPPLLELIRLFKRDQGFYFSEV